VSRVSGATRWALLAVAGLTMIGFALRLARYQQSLFGDEMSTLYIVDGRSLSDVLSRVSSDAEISPPLYFILAWATTKLGSAPELVRLPSLIAGTITIPLAYLVGLRAVSRPAGLLAATVAALSPFMIFYSADGRGYAVTIALLLCATLAMLAGVRDGRSRWWVLYGVSTAAAMYTHYTAAFVLLGQLIWLFWAHPVARRPAIVANVAAAVAYLPWMPGVLDDLDSPTQAILEVLQGSSFEFKRTALEVWVIGYPFRSPSEVPGVVAGLLGLVGFAIAAVAGMVSHLRARNADAAAGRERRPLVSPGMALAFALAFSPLIIELVLLAFGKDLLGARNVAVATAGLALFIGAVVASADRRWGTLAAIAVIAGYGIGAARTLETGNKLVDFKSAAAYIDSHAGPDEPVVDLVSPRATPVPLTELDVYMSGSRPEYKILLPEGEPPFLPLTPVPDPIDQLGRAVAKARGGTMFLVVSDTALVRDGDEVSAIRVEPLPAASQPVRVFEMPEGSRVVDEKRFPGLGPINVVEVKVP
jgi:Dolichyl-phosphate-mannose-protein mannosyltransferase